MKISLFIIILYLGISSSINSQDSSYYFIFRLYDEDGKLIIPKEKKIQDSELLILYKRGARILVNEDFDYYYDSINYIRIVRFNIVAGMSSVDIMFPNLAKISMDIRIDIDSLRDNLHNVYVDKIFYKKGVFNFSFPNSNEEIYDLRAFIFKNEEDTIKCYDISEYQTRNK